MPKPLEAKITKQCKDLFDKLKISYKGFYAEKISDRFTAGIPDFYVAYEGRSVWIELKKPGGVADPLQAHTIRRLKQAGIAAFCTDNFKDVERFIFGMVII